ncbi:MAG: hypothetical protein WDO73_37195 [Ignavibacteriota bacterium]
MNDKTNMQSESSGEITNREFYRPVGGDQPESVMLSLLALNSWLLAFEDRPDRADQRRA